MAQQLIFSCPTCGYSVESWGEGHPYIEGHDGKRHHFYHPGEDRQIRAIVQEMIGREPTRDDVDRMLRDHGGNEGDFLCLECRTFCKRNEREAKEPCVKCGSTNVVDTWRLETRVCPKCKKGTFGKGCLGAIS